MYWRREYLRKAASLAIGGTWREDLPQDGKLGTILCHISGSPVTDSMLIINKWRIWDYISKIEVIGNGAEVIKSITGPVARYLAWLDGGLAAPDKAFNYGSSTHRFHFPINFGRRFLDPEMGLDLKKWDNVEIQITNDAAAAQYASAMAVDALMYMLEGGPANAFPGYMRTEEWRKWTTVQAATQYLDLPTAHPIRRIILQVYPACGTNANADTTSYNVLYNIELNFQSGKIKVWNGNLRDLWYENAFEDGRDILQSLESYHTDGYGVWTGLGQTLGMGGVRLPHGGAQNTYGTSMLPGEDGATVQREVPSDADQDGLLALGLALENCAVFKFDQDTKPSTWLDPAVMAAIQLNCTTRDAATADNGTIRVILDRYVAR